MRKKAFKAESKRLLELMINSIYTHKEIFLRELISNASDAIDKLYFRTLQGNISGLSRDSFEIYLSVDKQARTLTIRDNGIGMTAQELENNLGTIAKSGSLSFKQDDAVENQEDISIIGQFGVGFYSAFMVAEKVTVVSRAYGEEQANIWQSDGVDGFTVEPWETDLEHGSIVTLTLKPDSDEEDYSKFLEQYMIQSLVRKYSDYIRYPIKMIIETTAPAEGDETEMRTSEELRTLNSMVPIWKKSKSELTEEDYNAFYSDKFFDFTPPLRTIHSYTEGTATFHALLFIPAKAPYNYYTKEYEKGLKLYSNGVLIMENCKDLLPDCFGFVRGLVDSQDLSLNISREILQHDRQLKIIAKALEKKIKNELLAMLRNDREKYEQFFESFGLALKYGIYSSYGAQKDLLGELLMFKSSADDKMTTLGEYCGRMRENQQYIYYAAGESISRISRLPQTERLLDLGYEILYLTQDVDEFALKVIGEWEEKQFRSVSGDDLGIDEGEESGKIEQTEEECRDMLDFMASALDGKVEKVRVSHRLKTHPVCISTEGMLSLEMERVLNAGPGDGEAKANRILELNSEHAVFAKLRTLYDADRDKLARFAVMLYNQALLIEGMPIEDPVGFAADMCALMAES